MQYTSQLYMLKHSKMKVECIYTCIHLILTYFVLEFNSFACVSAPSLHSESTNSVINKYTKFMAGACTVYHRVCIKRPPQIYAQNSRTVFPLSQFNSVGTSETICLVAGVHCCEMMVCVYAVFILVQC